MRHIQMRVLKKLLILTMKIVKFIYKIEVTPQKKGSKKLWEKL